MNPRPKPRQRLQRSGHIHHWTPEEDAIVRTKAPKEAAALIGVGVNAIYRRQRQLGVGLQARDLAASKSPAATRRPKSRNSDSLKSWLSSRTKTASG